MFALFFVFVCPEQSVELLGSDWVDVTVNSDGSISTSSSIDDFLQRLRDAGWKDKDWQNELQNKKDHGWDELFKNPVKQPIVVLVKMEVVV